MWNNIVWGYGAAQYVQYIPTYYPIAIYSSIVSNFWTWFLIVDVVADLDN